MNSSTTAKLLNNVSHPIRINIIKVLYAAPKSFSEILKLLSLESTGKLSFHLESLRPLIDKDKDGNYILTAQGLSIYSFLGSIESDSIIADIIPMLDIAPIKEITQKTSFFAQIKQIPFYLHLCILILLGSLYYIFLVIQNFEYLSFVESFAPSLFIILFLLPVFFYVNHLYFCQKTEKSFSYLSLGMLTYTILYPICLLLLEQTHYLLKALLDIPEWSLSYDFVTQSMVYSEWFYYPGDLLEILTLYGKTILFNDFTRNPSVVQAFNLPRSIFWFVFCCFFLLFLFFFSFLVNWNWASSSRHSHSLFSGKIRFLEDGKYWGILVSVYVILSLFFLNTLAIPTKVESIETFFSSLDYFLPSYIQLFPILPSLIITVLIFWVKLVEVAKDKKKVILISFSIIITPLIYWLISIIEYFHLLTLVSSSVSINYLISHIIIGSSQLLALCGLTILLNLVKKGSRREGL